MIRSLSGTVISVDDSVICLDVSGFGLEVYASGSLLAQAQAGEPLFCRAYLQVSDAGPTLFGFANDVERELFQELTQVKTMGGKLSIALLRHLDVESIVSAILSEDPMRLAVPGLGPKRAQRICFELQAKVEKKIAPMIGAEASVAVGGSVDRFVVAGLTGLGFSQSEAVRAVTACRAEREGSECSEEDLMKSALSLLQKR